MNYKNCDHVNASKSHILFTVSMCISHVLINKLAYLLTNKHDLFFTDTKKPKQINPGNETR